MRGPNTERKITTLNYTKAGLKPTHELFAVKEGADSRAFWTKIGAAWPHKRVVFLEVIRGRPIIFGRPRWDPLQGLLSLKSKIRMSQVVESKSGITYQFDTLNRSFSREISPLRKRGGRGIGCGS